MLRLPYKQAGGRLPSYIRPKPIILHKNLHISSRLRHTPDPFFTSNQISSAHHDELPTDPKLQVEQYLRSQSHFINPKLHYPAVEITDSAIMGTVLEHTFEPFKSWREIAQNQMAVPIPGTFVEFQTPNSNIAFGVVVSEPKSKFNEFHNKLIVLTMDNELLRVYPQDIEFSAYQVLEEDWIDALEILPNRFDEDYAPRTRLVTILHQYVALAQEMRSETKELLRLAYSRQSCDSSVLPVSLTSVLEAQTVSDHQSYFHQCAKLLSVHWEMSADPSRWIVSTCLAQNQANNILAHRCSNELPPVAVYMATPLSVYNDVKTLMRYDSKQLERLDDYLKSLLESPKRHDELLNDINIWSGKQFAPAIRAIMYGAFHPHTKITQKLAKLSFFSQGTSPECIQENLRKIGLFDSAEHTDVVLSSGVLGSPQRLVASSSDDLDRSRSQLVSLQDTLAGNFRDHFRHLRSQRQYYLDMTVYGLDTGSGGLKMLLSLEKINERKYMINLHVPDVASHLCPASSTFETWTRDGGILRSVSELLNAQEIGTLHKKAIEALLFDFPESPSTLFSVGDVTKSDLTVPCMTLTFEYNIYDNNPLQKIGDRISLLFDQIRQSQVKVLDSKILDGTLTGKLKPRLLDSFRLFSRTEPTTPQLVNESDHFNINFIYNTMTRHFMQRNRRCAALVAPKTMRKDVTTKLEIIGDGETDNCRVWVESAEEIQNSSKRAFFLNELKIFAGAMAAEYAHRKNIPVFRKSQTLLDQSTHSMQNTESDEVFISHENKFLPNFHGNSYFQTMLARDSRGYVSPAAYFIGNNFLGQEKIAVSGPKENLPLGLPLGFVDVFALNSVEAYLNQLQLLLHHHGTTQKQRLHSYVAQFSYLKKYGFPLHGPFLAEILENFTARIETSHLAANYLAHRQRAYWTLLHVEQMRRETQKINYNCIITRLGAPINFQASLAWAFCEELSMEIRLYVRTETDLSIGSRVKAHRVLHVSAADNICVFEHKEAF